MKQITLFIILTFTTLLTVARNDPFNNSNLASNHSAITLNCLQDHPSIATHIPFEQLKLVGVMISAHQSQLLFTDDIDLYPLNMGEIISQQQLQFINIQQQKIDFYHWQQSLSCEQPKRISIYF